mgnify:CR=1 FL=1
MDIDYNNPHVEGPRPEDEVPACECPECGEPGLEQEDGDFLCAFHARCLEESRNEARYERSLSDYYGGGGPEPLLLQQERARRLK